MKNANLLDTRNIYEPDMVRGIGFNYVCVGRTNVGKKIFDGIN
jgi:hypothetical protein